MKFPPMPHREESTLFVIAVDTPGGDLTVPAGSARLLAAGDSLPPVWIAVCGHHIKDVEFEVLDLGLGRPCRDCQQRRAAPHPQRTVLPVRSPGPHLHPQLRREAGNSP